MKSWPKKQPARHGVLRSIFERSIRSWGWVLFALLAVLPLLALVRLGMLAWGAGLESPLQSFQFVALVGFVFLSLAAGLYLLHYLIWGIRQTWRESMDLAYSAKIEGQRSIESSREVLATDFQGALISGGSGGNELTSVATSLHELREFVSRLFERIQDQAGKLETFEMALEWVSDAILLVDGENTLIFANRAAKDEFGIVSGMPLRRALAESTLAHEAWNLLAERLESWNDQRDELVFTHDEEGQRNIALTVSIHESPSGKSWEVVILRDVTERRRLERQLFRSERLAALGQLISGVAHELNNPLAAISGFSELCRDPEISREDLQHHLLVIEEEARRTHHIVQDLLSFSRRRGPQRSATDVHELLDRCLSLLSYQFRVQNIVVQREYGGALPVLSLDEHQIQQVFMNLMINAAQAMREANTVEPTIWIRTGVRSEDRAVVVEIRDNGPGIPESKLAKIFEPFYTTKPEGIGTGLGLAVCEAIVSKHGGTITVESREGAGACFRVTLPRPAQTVRLRVRKRRSESFLALERFEHFKGLRGRILLVDDEEAVRDLAQHVLQQVGLEVAPAADIREARSWLKQTRFSAAVCDIRLPDGDAAVLWNAIAEMQPNLLASTLFITGDPRAVELLERKIGVKRPVVFKPFQLEEFCAKVVALLGASTPDRDDNP